jgi:putative ABC transport system substrate-binding protein
VKRREFIGLAAGAVVSLPSAAQAQQNAVPIVGFLDSGSRDGMEENLVAFRRGLSETGLIESQHFGIEFRWAQGRYDQLPDLATGLVRVPVAVIAATRSSAPGRAAKAATATIPVVFQTGSDPVKDGLVSSMNRPSGNVTGVTRLSTALVPKRLGVVTDLVPNAKEIALLVNPIGPQTEEQIREMKEAARRLGLQVHVVNASREQELPSAFATSTRHGARVLIVATDNLFIDRRETIIALAKNHAIPVMYPERQSVAAGGLMTYAASLEDSFRQAGVYVGRILKGAKPSDLPVLQPDKFELVINLKTAKELGLEIPPKLLALADEVIE